MIADNVFPEEAKEQMDTFIKDVAKVYSKSNGKSKISNVIESSSQQNKKKKGFLGWFSK